MYNRRAPRKHTKRSANERTSNIDELDVLAEYTKQRKEVLIYDYIIAQLGTKEFTNNNNPIGRTNRMLKEKRRAFIIDNEEVKKIKEEHIIVSKKRYADVVRGFVPEKNTILPPVFRDILVDEQSKSTKIDRRAEHDIIKDYSERYNNRSNYTNKGRRPDRVFIPVNRVYGNVEARNDDDEDIIDRIVEVVNREAITAIRLEAKHFMERHVRIRGKYKTLVLISFETGGKDKSPLYKNLPLVPMFPELHGTIIDVDNLTVINRSLPLPRDCVVPIAYSNERYNTTVSWTDYWMNYQKNLLAGNYSLEGEEKVPIAPNGSKFYFPVPEGYNFNTQSLRVTYKDYKGNDVVDEIDMRNYGNRMSDKNITINIGTEGIVLVVMRLFGETIYATHKAFNPPHLKELFDKSVSYITSPDIEGRPFYREGCNYSPFVYTYMITDPAYVSNSQYIFPPTQLLTQVIWTPSENDVDYVDCPYNYDGKVEAFEYNSYHLKDYKGGKNYVQPSYVPGNILWGILFYGVMEESLRLTRDYSYVRSIAQENFTDGHFIIITKTDDNGKVLKNYKLMSKSYNIKHELTGGKTNLYNVFITMLGKLNNKNVPISSLFEDRIITDKISITDFIGESEDMDQQYETLKSNKYDICYYAREESNVNEVIEKCTPIGRLKHDYYNLKCNEIRDLLEKDNDSFWLTRYNIAVVFCNFVMCYVGNKFAESMPLLHKFYNDLNRVTNFIIEASKDPNVIERIRSDSYMTIAKHKEVRKKIYGILETMKGEKINSKTVKNKLLTNNLGHTFYKIYSTLEKLSLLKD